MFGKGRQRQGMRRVPLAKAYRMVETVIISRREYPSHTHTHKVITSGPLAGKSTKPP